MNIFRKIIVLLLTQLLLLSQIHISVFAIHCLCTDQIHFSLTAEKDCSSEQCKMDLGNCCDSSDVCVFNEHQESYVEGTSCHAPKASIEIGLDLHAMVSASSELQSQVRFSDVPLFILFAQLKITSSSELNTNEQSVTDTQWPPGFRYLLFGEMLC